MKFAFGLKFQEAALEEMKKELQARPTSKLVDDLRKKVKILQVTQLPLKSARFSVTSTFFLWLWLLYWKLKERKEKEANSEWKHYLRSLHNLYTLKLYCNNWFFITYILEKGLDGTTKKEDESFAPWVVQNISLLPHKLIDLKYTYVSELVSFLSLLLFIGSSLYAATF